MSRAQIRRPLSAIMVFGLLAVGGGRMHARMSWQSGSDGMLAGTGRCPQSWAVAINRQGDIVGYCILNEASAATQQVWYSVRFRAGRAALIQMHHSRSDSTDATGINSEGNIVGDYTDLTGHDRGFLLRFGHYTAFGDPLDPRATDPTGINDAGDIVGFYLDRQGETYGFVLHRGRYSRLTDPRGFKGETVATGLNNRGDVVDHYIDARRQIHGFLFHRGHYLTLDDPAASNAKSLGTWPNGINDRGEVVGYYFVNRYLDTEHRRNVSHGFLLRAGRYSAIDVPHSVSTAAHGINVQGDIVGDYLDAHQIEHGFLLHAGHFTTIDFPKPRG